MSKTVIFGGTFNPPHIGHQEMLQYLQNREDVGRILVVPNRAPVHKVGFSLASDSHRLNMCKALAADFPKAEVWDIELCSNRKSYTYFTLLDYRDSYGDDRPFIFCGADMAVTLKTWYNYQELLKLCGIMAVFRGGSERDRFHGAILEIRQDGGEVEEINVPFTEVSSTAVRELLSSGQDASSLLPASVSSYIEQNRLYTENTDITIEQYKEHLRKRLTPRRYYHSLCVSDEAVRLADRYGADKQKAFLAGLLHDTLKDTNINEQLKFAKEFGIILDDLEISAPKLYHSLIGCEYVRRILRVDDDEIINAIKYHTTAKAQMTLLEKIIYLADYTSLDRDYPGVEEMRKAVDISLESAMKIALEYTVEELNSKGVSIHPNTLAAFRQYTKSNRVCNRKGVIL